MNLREVPGGYVRQTSGLPSGGSDNPLDREIEVLANSAGRSQRLVVILRTLRQEFDDFKLREMQDRIEMALQEKHPALKELVIEAKCIQLRESLEKAVKNELDPNLLIKSFEPAFKPSQFVRPVSDSEAEFRELRNQAKKDCFKLPEGRTVSRLVMDSNAFEKVNNVREVRNGESEELFRKIGSNNILENAQIATTASKIEGKPNKHLSKIGDILVEDLPVQLHLKYKPFIDQPKNDIVMRGLETQDPFIRLKKRFVLPSSNFEPTCIALLNSDCVVVGNSGGQVCITDMKISSIIQVSRYRIRTIKADGEFIYCGSENPESDGLFLVSCANTNEREELVSNTGKGGTLSISLLRKPGDFISSTKNGKIFFWSFSNSKSPIRVIDSCNCPVNDIVSVSNQRSRYVIAGCHDGSIRVYEKDQNDCAKYMFSNEDPIMRIEPFGQNQRYFLTTNSVGKIGLWDFEEEK